MAAHKLLESGQSRGKGLLDGRPTGSGAGGARTGDIML